MRLFVKNYNFSSKVIHLRGEGNSNVADSVQKKFQLDGVPAGESRDILLENTLKIVGVLEAELMDSGELVLGLARHNPLLPKLLQYVVEKVSPEIVITDISA